MDTPLIRADDLIPLQPLRVPAGWLMAFNQGLYEIDPSPELFADEPSWWFKQDMLQMRHEGFDRLLDLGWYPEGDLVNGVYGLVIHAGDFGGELLYELRTRNRQELVKAIENNLSQIANGKL
jgi:hypothetical protein